MNVLSIKQTRLSTPRTSTRKRHTNRTSTGLSTLHSNVFFSACAVRAAVHALASSAPVNPLPRRYCRTASAMDPRRRGAGEWPRRVEEEVEQGGSSEHAAFSTDGCASRRACAERSVRSSESRLSSWSPSEGPWSRLCGLSRTLALGSLRSWLMVASGPLHATATGAPKSITDSRDGTLGRFELLPHQLDICAIIVPGGPPVQEGLWAPSLAPELEPLKLPSREAVASLIAPAPLMSAATATTHRLFVLRLASTVVCRPA